MGDQLKFSSLFGPADVLCRTRARSRDELLMLMLNGLAERKRISNTKEAFDALIERETEASSLLANGIAVPHARIDSIANTIVTVATSVEGVVFGSNPEDKAHLVVMILSPKDSPSAHLKSLGALAMVTRSEKQADHVAALQSSADVWHFFDRGGLILPPFVCAGDIMTANFPKLRDNETLEAAIDGFVRHTTAELPVVDKDGDLVGVVTEDELLHVCLPDYILWMEDLSPIIDFQPFAQILINESKTWLTDIMSSTFCTVQVDTPAVQVAKEMCRHQVRQVYVLADKKLVGVISIQEFIDKVLRA